ncbi:hypothetical protein DFS34DRAFT_645377 [Phlyctochytrium arcticum]|nr:hypothetical protein DFS34DRAFT_645377 [Phlyctochytrium arcticum]
MSANKRQKISSGPEPSLTPLILPELAPAITPSNPPQKTVLKNSPYHYFTLTFGKPPTRQFTLPQFRQAIHAALKDLFGIVGSSHTVDILKFVESKQWALIRTGYESLPALRMALTLMTSYNDLPCAFEVMASSPYLFSLAVDSRDWTV